MHILFLTDNFPPEVNAPASRTFEHCREWVKAGHRVTVITCAPNFPKGKVFDGYRNRLWQRERMEGIEVIRVWSYITANEGFARRVLDYLSFMLSAILAGPWVRGVDVIVGTSPQFFTSCAAYVVSRLKGVPYVFELRDLWPESIKAVGAMKDSRLIRMLERLEMFLYRKSAAVVSVTESFKRVLVRRGIDGSKIHVVTNGVDISQFKPRAKDAELTRRLGLEGKFVAGYIGTHGMAHALETILEAADRLRGKGFAFILLGDGARKQSLKDLARERDLDNVVFIDSVPKSDVARYWSLLDVSIIHLRRTELFTTVIPSKLFECMGMGIPVLHGVEGESADIVREQGVGLPFRPENVEELCSALTRLRADTRELAAFRANCLAAAGRFDRRFLAGSMLDVLIAVGGEDRQASGLRAAGVPAKPSTKVLILNQSFWPDVAATAQHAFDLARFLQSHGDEVTAIASRSIYGQSGGALPEYEVRDGITIHRVGTSRFGKAGILSRAFDFVAFNVACLFKAFSLPRHDVVVCLTTPPFIAFIGWLLRATQGTKFVFWTMDLYPDVPLAAGVIRRGSPGHRLFDLLDRFCLRRADLVVVLGRCMRNRILSKGVSPAKVELITPWSDPQEVRVLPSREIGSVAGARVPTRTSPGPQPVAQAPASNAFRSEWDIGDRFVIEYSGNCGVGHDVTSVCEAMLTLRDDDSIRWVFVGGGVTRPRIEEFIEKHRIPNVLMHPYQPRERLGELIALGDAHLVLVADGFGGLLLPSKFYGVMAAARPTVYVGPPDSEVAKVIEEVGCGYAVPNADGSTLVAAIRALQADPAAALAMGLRGRRALESNYSMEIACDRWREAIHRVASAP